jgi:hypothetical protein
MRPVERFVIVSARLCRDEEKWRWYSDGADGCVVLTERGRLLEPHPLIGPTSFRLLAFRVSLEEARTYASAHAFTHERLLPPVPRIPAG